MYSVSSEYLEKIVSDDIMATWYGSIKSKSGIVYNITADNINLGNTKFIHEVTSGTSLEIGTAYSKELELAVYVEYDIDSQQYTLNDVPVNRYDFYDSEIHLYFRLYLDEEQQTYEDVPCGGTFYTAVPEIADDTLTLTAYDGMEKFKQLTSQESVGVAYDYLSWICNACDVELGSTQEEIEALPNSDLPVYLYKGVNIETTYLDALAGITAMLSSFAVLGTDDKLYVRQFTMTPIRSISDDWRYAIQISDYETHYNSVALTDLVNEKIVTSEVAEDEGLQYDLGENPFLQYGLDETKQVAVDNILEQLNTITYTPFEATVPIDPSLEVGDILEFTEGRAVSGKYAAIMSVEYSLDGSTTIKCVGDNPKLLSANDSTDRELQKLLNTIDSRTIYYYDYVNVQEINIADGQQAIIISIRYVTSAPTHIDFHAEVKHELTVTNTEVSPYATLKVTYFIDDEEVEEYYPIQDEFAGTHLLHLLFTFMAKENIRGKFVALLEVTNGSIHIDVNCARAYIAGQGLVTKEAEWDGTLDLYDEISLFNPINYVLSFTDAVSVDFHRPLSANVSDTLSLTNPINQVLSFTDNASATSNIMVYNPWVNVSDVTTNATVGTTSVGWQGAGDISAGTAKYVIFGEVKGVTRVETFAVGGTYYASPDGGNTWYGYGGGGVWVLDYGMSATELKNTPAIQWNKMDTVKIKVLIPVNESIHTIDMYGADTDIASIDRYIMSTVNGNKSYDTFYVIIENDDFELRTNYTYNSEARNIDSGFLSVIDIDTSNFDSVTSITVS